MMKVTVHVGIYNHPSGLILAMSTMVPSIMSKYNKYQASRDFVRHMYM